MQLFHLSKLPHALDLEHVIEQASYLFKNHPPESLPFGVWRRISRNSVLKTTRDSSNVSRQTLEEGELLFAKQEAELRRQQWLDGIQSNLKRTFVRHRRPAILTAAAVAVGVMAWWLGRTSHPVVDRIMSLPLLNGFFGDFAKSFRGHLVKTGN